MKKAAFSLEDIIFSRVLIESSKLPLNEISIEFIPSGVFKIQEKTFDLKLVFLAFGEENKENNNFIELELLANFEFYDVNKLEEIPEYFYTNAIAIVYPYIRAFLTSIVFQANLKRKILLPIMNLSDLGETLKVNISTI
jgi:preprotein translocase subunit SecB